MCSAPLLEDPAQILQAADRDDVADEDPGPEHPLDQPEEEGEPSWSLIRLVSPTGTTKKRPIASAIEKTIVRPQTQPPISSGSPSSSSSSWALAEIARA